MFESIIGIITALGKVATLVSLKVLIIICLTLVFLLLIWVVYKIASNHVNHLTMGVTELTKTLKETSTELNTTIKDLNKCNADDHKIMISEISRLIGRTE